MEGQDSKSTRRELDWQFCQVFGEPHFEEVTEVDIVSTVEFDSTGEYLAAGDRGGRVVIFQRVEVRQPQTNLLFSSRGPRKPTFLKEAFRSPLTPTL
jgi:serine/threonine-protein phosphatase 2A regulatory subunit B